MASSKSHCSLNYHEFGSSDLEAKAHAVSEGIYTHNPPFALPPIATKIAFDGVTAVFHDAAIAYQNGGLDQKGDYMVARTNLIAQMDVTAFYVDKQPGVNDDMITLAGYTPTKTGETQAVIPYAPTGIVITRGVSGELISTCNAQHGVVYFGCIVVTGKPLPDGFVISNAGQIIIHNNEPTPPPLMEAKADSSGAILDLTKGRRKHFTGLTKGVDYYFYYYAANSAGVSQLSEPVVIMCG